MMNSAFDLITLTIPGQAIVSFMGTVAFAILFGMPKRLYLSTGIIGMAGWLIYTLLVRYTSCTVVIATFFAMAAIGIMSRYFSVWKKAPSTIFIIAGIIPIVPGGGIFWTVYYLMTNQFADAFQAGFTAIKVMLAIVLGIVLSSELPAAMFRIRKN